MAEERINTRDLRNLHWDIHVDRKSWRDGDIHMVLLIDIREELKKLNDLLHCSNFTDIPNILRDIRKNTTRRVVRKKKK